MKFDTKVIHGGATMDKTTGSVNVPIYQTSTYKQTTFAKHTGYEYSRTANPTRDALERLVATLEGGHEGFAFASGMAAISTVFSMFEAGSHLIISDNVYGGTYRLLNHVFMKFGVTYTAVDTSNLELMTQAIKPQTVAIFLESPTNPLLGISDIKAIATIAKKHSILTIVDNTFMSPYLQQPLLLGADLVVHSGTKYLGGHSDLVAGVAVTNRDDVAQSLRFLQNAMGAILGPQDAFLLIRGIKTLPLRMARHIANTEKIVTALSTHPAIARLIHPSLKTHRNHEIFIEQTKGSVPIIAFEVAENVDISLFGESLNVILVAESLGGVESLISLPASMTHASYPQETREALGITNRILRLSVGVEDAQDLIDDIFQALQKATDVTR